MGVPDTYINDQFFGSGFAGEGSISDLVEYLGVGVTHLAVPVTHS